MAEQYYDEVNDGNRRDENIQINDGDNAGGNTNVRPLMASAQIFTIKSNISGATILINDTWIGKTTNGNFTISKKQLYETGDRVVTISKVGYSTKQSYRIFLSGNVDNVTKNTLQSEYFGLNQTNVSVEYLVNGVNAVYTDDSQGNKTVLPFKLEVADVEIVDTQNLLKINLSGVGNPVSILKNSKNSAEFFPKIGSSKYQDKTGTIFKIRSSNVNLYRITKLIISGKGITEKSMLAGATESLTIKLELKQDYTLSIETELVSDGISTLDPQIKLIKTDMRTYNINSQTGVPIAFEKNKDVKAITIIIGDDILEYDDLEEGSIAGVTIPANVFNQIGKYNTKIFPFSLSDYENEVRPDTPIPIITPKPFYPTLPIVDEDIVVKPDTSIRDNPYISTRPISTFNGGGFNPIGTPSIFNQNYTGEVSKAVIIDEKIK